MLRDERQIRCCQAASAAMILLVCAFAAPIAAMGAEPAPLVGCGQRVEGSKPRTGPYRGLIAVPAVLRLGAPKGAYIAGPGVQTPEGMAYKITVGVNAGVPARTVWLRAVEPGVMLSYAGTTARALRLRACVPGHPGFGTNPPVGQWTGWAGGIVVAEAMCVHLVAKEGSRWHHFRLGLGVRCP